jgi:hypothetical protein
MAGLAQSGIVTVFLRRETCSRHSLAPVAQLDRVLPSEGRGRTFESSRARQFSTRQIPLTAPTISRAYRALPTGFAAPKFAHISAAL